MTLIENPVEKPIVWHREHLRPVPAAARAAACQQALDRGSGNDKTRTLLLEALVEAGLPQEAIRFAKANPRAPGADLKWDYHLSNAWQWFGDARAALDVVDAALLSAPSSHQLLLRRFTLLTCLDVQRTPLRCSTPWWGARASCSVLK